MKPSFYPPPGIRLTNLRGKPPHHYVPPATPLACLKLLLVNGEPITKYHPLPNLTEPPPSFDFHRSASMTSPTSRVGTWLFPSSLWFNEATTEVAVVAAFVATNHGRKNKRGQCVQSAVGLHPVKAANAQAFMPNDSDVRCNATVSRIPE